MYSGVKALFNRSKKLKGSVVLIPKNVLDTNSITSVKGVVQTTMSVVGSTFIDSLSAFSGKCVSLRLISATKAAGITSLSLFHFFSINMHHIQKTCQQPS